MNRCSLTMFHGPEPRSVPPPCSVLPMFFVLLIQWTASITVAAQDPLAVSPRVLDFGSRGHGETVPLTLELINRSNSPLNITELKPSCGCTKVSPARLTRPLAPGERISLRVTMSSGRAIGNLNKYISIRSDRDAPNYRRKIATKMSVFSGFRQEPRTIRLAGEVGGQRVTRTIDLLRPGTPFAISVDGVYLRGGRTSRRSSHFEIRKESIDGGHRLHLSVLPSLAEGRFMAEVRALVDGKDFVIAFSGEMFRGIKLSSSYFSFQRVQSSDAKSLFSTTELISIDGTSFRILDAVVTWQRGPEGTPAGTETGPGLTTGPSRVQLDVKPITSLGHSTQRLEARMLFAGDASLPPPTGSFSGTVAVRTDHPKKPLLTLRFMGFFPTTHRSP